MRPSTVVLAGLSIACEALAHAVFTVTVKNNCPAPLAFHIYSYGNQSLATSFLQTQSTFSAGPYGPDAQTVSVWTDHMIDSSNTAGQHFAGVFFEQPTPESDVEGVYYIEPASYRTANSVLNVGIQVTPTIEANNGFCPAIKCETSDCNTQVVRNGDQTSSLQYDCDAEVGVKPQVLAPAGQCLGEHVGYTVLFCPSGAFPEKPAEQTVQPTVAPVPSSTNEPVSTSVPSSSVEQPTSSSTPTSSSQLPSSTSVSPSITWPAPTGIPTPTVPREPSFVLHPKGDSSKCMDIYWVDVPFDGVPVIVNDCSERRTNTQSWVIQRGATSVRLEGTNYCLDSTVPLPEWGTEMKLWTCYSDLPAQEWWYTEDNRVALKDRGQCLDTKDGYLYPGNLLQSWQCTDHNQNQVFTAERVQYDRN